MKPINKPEYVKCIYNKGTLGTRLEIDKIYKVNVKKTTGDDLYLQDFSVGIHKSLHPNNKSPNLNYHTGFTVSTKEEYDAQFVVKEPEFVLPERWYIKTDKKSEESKIIGAFFDDQTGYACYSESCLGQYYNSHNNINQEISEDRNGKFMAASFAKRNVLPNSTEITFEQFKKYVLKEDVKVLEEPIIELKDSILEYRGEVKHTDQAISVQSSEGGIFKIGDKITPFDKYSPNKGKMFTIQSFRWSNDKSKICAVTELHTPNGIGLNKIELYIEPKVKVKDDFVLPENWYIKVTDDNKEVLQQYILNIHNLTMITLSNINYVAYSKWLYGINQTENKLGHGLISKLNLNPLPNIYRTVTYYNGVEITFEQFKKYVLNEKI